MTLITLILQACQERLSPADYIKLYRAIGALMAFGGMFLMTQVHSTFGALCLISSMAVFAVAGLLEQRSRR